MVPARRRLESVSLWLPFGFPRLPVRPPPSWAALQKADPCNVAHGFTQFRDLRDSGVGFKRWLVLDGATGLMFADGNLMLAADVWFGPF